MLIRISAKAWVADSEGNPIRNPVLIKQIEETAAEGLISDYFGVELASLGITGGAVKLVYDSRDQVFRVASEFSCHAPLTDSQLDALCRETDGQWSDGIGEGGFVEAEQELHVSIDLWPHDIDRDIRIEQVNDGRELPPPTTMLPIAAFKGDFEAVKQLLDKGEDIESRWQGSTGLHLSLLAGHKIISEFLIERGADIFTLDRQGMDPLMLCTISNVLSDEESCAFAKLFLGRGVNPETKRGGGHNQETPLYMARNRKKTSLARLFRDYRRVNRSSTPASPDVD